jgi:ribosomal protein L11 methyltransferase
MNDSAKVWQSLRLTVEPDAVEALEFAFNSLDALGTEIDFMLKPANGVCVVGYFDGLPADEILQDELHYALRIYGLDENAIISVERKEIENTDWLAEWKKHWKPTTVGRFVIAPPWETVDEPNKIVIRIEPNMAFGTGTHETTQLCLKAIDRYCVPVNSFLDVGTGTGILAIAAAKLAVQHTKGTPVSPMAKILAIDTDPDSIKIALENAVLNDVHDMVQVDIGELSSETSQFDFVCANLTLDVILPILPLLLSKARANLILSGILVEQESFIVQALSANDVNDLSIERSGEWIAITVQV